MQNVSFGLIDLVFNSSGAKFAKRSIFPVEIPATYAPVFTLTRVTNQASGNAIYSVIPECRRLELYSAVLTYSQTPGYATAPCKPSRDPRNASQTIVNHRSPIAVFPIGSEPCVRIARAQIFAYSLDLSRESTNFVGPCVAMDPAVSAKRACDTLSREHIKEETFRCVENKCFDSVNFLSLYPSDKSLK